MFLSFRDNVVFTMGALRSTISDYNTRKLYHLTEAETKFVSRVIGVEEESPLLTAVERADVSFLISLGLLDYREDVLDGRLKLILEPNIDFAWVEVTTRCNLQCIHCYDESDCHRQEAMSPAEFKLVTDELLALGIKRVQIIGGEPLALGPVLAEMLAYASGKFESVEVFTNGTLLSDWWADFFRDHQIKVALSVYSYDSITHDAVTKADGSHALTNCGIERLAIRGVPYRIANVLMKDVCHGEKNTALYQLNSDKDVVRMSGRGNLKLLSKELLSKKLITQKRFESPLNRRLLKRICWGHNCFSRRLYISADLNVYPCVMERRLCHGSLRKAPLQALLKDEILFLGKDHISECKDCEFRYCCHDCRPDSLSEDTTAKPWNCTYDPYSGKWANIEQFINQLSVTYGIKF